MSLFNSLRSCLDAYTLEELSITLNRGKLAVVQPTVTNFARVEWEALTNLVNMWTADINLDQLSPNTNVLEFRRTDSFLNGKLVNLERLFCSENGTRTAATLNINGYLAPFKDSNISELLFTYEGGGDDGNCYDEGSWLKPNYWKNSQATEYNLNNLTWLVECLCGDFNGEPYRSGTVKIDLVNTTINIAATEGGPSFEFMLNKFDYACNSRSSYALDAVDFAFTLAKSSYLIIHNRFVYTASTLGIFERIGLASDQKTKGVLSRELKTLTLTTDYVNLVGFAAGYHLLQAYFKESQTQNTTTPAVRALFELCNPEYIYILPLRLDHEPCPSLVIEQILEIYQPIKTDNHVPPLTDRPANWFERRVAALATDEMFGVIEITNEIASFDQRM
jgi:hypothetical protein